MIFAPPLLTYLLIRIGQHLVNLVTRGDNSHGAVLTRVSFGIGYFALPSLYAAFNTFKPVHDWIINIFSIATTGGPGSPLDATDSLVIPIGMGIALWVWSRRLTTKGTFRNRVVALVASVAMLGSIASTEMPVPLGITNVETADGVVFADAWSASIDSIHDGAYISRDGGLTWDASPDKPIDYVYAVAGEVVTPNGTYTISGTDVIRSEGESSEIVYSADPLWEEENYENRFAKLLWSNQERSEVTGSGYARHHVLRDMAYDTTTGNVIVGMGRKGGVVIDSDGNWTRVAIGENYPPRVVTVASLDIWIIGIVLAASFVSLTITFRNFIKPKHRAWALLVPPILVGIVFFIIVVHNIASLFGSVSGLRIVLTALVLFFGMGVFSAAMELRNSDGLPSLSLVLGLLGVVFSISALAFASIGLWGGNIGPTLAGLAIISAVANASLHMRKEHMLGISIAILSMFALYAVAILLWLADTINTVALLIAVTVLMILSARVFSERINRLLER